MKDGKKLRTSPVPDAVKPSPQTPADMTPTGSANGHGKGVMLRLYVAGQTPKSLAALANLKRLCDEHLAARYTIELEVVDLMVTPQRAVSDQILAIPTLVRRLPSPIKKIIGDLSNTERVLVGLDVSTTR